jgi:hypothetical protein
MSARLNPKHLGGDFDEFLREEGLLDEVNAVATTRVQADRNPQTPEEQAPQPETSRSCWAHALGDCGGGRSKEHLISRGLLRSEPVTVSGLDWCREPKTIPVSGLAANILCKKHNSSLSPVDAAGIQAMTDLEKFLQVRGIRRRKVFRQREPQHYAVEGPLLERWMLKTMINVAFEHITPGGARWSPPAEWVQLAFGRRSFPARCGLYLSDPRDSALALERSKLRIEFMTQDGLQMHGAEFDLNGWAVTLSLVPLEARRSDYRPSFVRDRDGLKTRQVIAFAWA